MVWLVGALLGPACQVPEKNEGSSETTAEPSTGAVTGPDATTGSALCVLEIGGKETFEDDPDGCYAITDEAGCLAKPEQCTTNRGYPATCTGEKQWCLSAAEPVFLGCRPFVICKEAELIVGREFEFEIEAFWSERCIPPGFGKVTPGVPDGGLGPPPACAG